MSTRTSGFAPNARDDVHSALEVAVRPWPEIPTVVVAVRRADSWLQTAWSSRGVADPGAGFRTASVTKTFTAASALVLVDRNRLPLDEPVAEYLSASARALLPRLVTRPDEVTLRHLLQHTAGIADYWKDPNWQREFTNQPQHEYEAIEMLRYVADCLEPLGDIGVESRYSDTGYVLVADLIATATGRPWPQAMRELLDYARLGLRSTWVEEREPPPAPRPSLAPSNMMGRDLWSIHPSYDTVGGGGLVSTAPDLVRFFSELLGGRVVAPQSLTQMQSVRPWGVGDGIGLGLFCRETPLGTAWGHTGVHGAFAYVVPEQSLAIAGSICSLDSDYDKTRPVREVVTAITQALVPL
jgi:D-alanyl-D-alanine carboxypeptidase